MKAVKVAALFGLAFALVSPSWVFAAEKPPKLTCCQQAQAKKEECKHKCCVAAHQAKKSCEKCNPNKEDLKKEPKSGGK